MCLNTLCYLPAKSFTYIWYEIDINLKFNVIIYVLLNWKKNSKEKENMPLWNVNHESSLTMVNHGQNMVDYVVCSGFDSSQLWPWLTMIWLWSDCVKNIEFF